MVATLDGVPFSIDPTSVRWQYTVAIADNKFLGGKVIQVLGARIGDISVSGQFGRFDTDQDQIAFMNRMKAYVRFFAANPRAEPLSFSWPEQGWDFKVYIKGMSPRSGERSIVIDNYPYRDWNLRLFPVTGTNQLQQSTITSFIERLTTTLGWRATKYNGSMSLVDVQQAIQNSGASDLSDYFQQFFGPTGGSSGGIVNPSTGSGYPTDRILSVQEVLQVASSVGFRGTDLRIAVAVAQGESGFNPQATLESDLEKSIGIWQINTKAHTQYGTVEELRDPKRNASAAFAIYTNAGNKFTDWTVYTKGIYQQFLASVSAAADQMGL